MKIFKFLWISTSFKVFKALRRLPKRLKTLELRSGDTHKNSNVPQMLLLLRKPSDQKYFYWWTVRLHLNFYVHKNLKITFCLAKISLWSVWRDLREAKCVDLVVNYMKSSNFCGSPLSFKVFKALRRLPKRLKTLELRREKCSSNAFGFWGNRLIKKYFYWWTVRLHLNFYVHKNLKMLS